MILDQFGKPIRTGNTFETPNWVKRETVRNFHNWSGDLKVQALRESVEQAAEVDGSRVGQTITVAVGRALSSHDRSEA